jgi:oligosaccharide repeat unit polymerase
VNRSNASRRNGSLPRIVSVALFGLAALAAFVPTRFLSESDFSWGPGAMAVAAFLLFVLHLGLVWRRTTPLDPVVWLPLAILLFYFGIPITVETGGRELGLDYDAWYVGLPTNLSRGFCGALLALAAYLLGMHAAGVKDLSKVTARASPDPSLALPSLLLTLGSIAMMAVGVVVFGPAALFGGYQDYWDAKRLGADPRFIDMGTVFLQAGVFGLIASHHPKRSYRLYFALTVAAFLALLIVEKGARGMLMATGVGVVWCYIQRVRRLNSVVVTAAALVGILALPVLGEYRHTKQLGALERSSLQTLLVGSLHSMGSSVYTLSFTMDIVPEREDYAWGIGYVESAYDLIPNVGLRPSRTRLFSSPKVYHSNWLAWQVNPDWAANGGGYSSSMAGELYFNFGVLGILLGCALFGYLSAQLRNSSQDSALKLAASALFFGGMIAYVRNPFGGTLKQFVWPLIAFIVIRGVLSLLSRRAASARMSRPVPL